VIREVRIDLLLKYLCLAKSRNQARMGCESGNIRLDGKAIKPSQQIRKGDILEIRYPGRSLVLEILDIPVRQVSRKRKDKYIRTIREE
jgi:ribosomal 50S subunit-recycling heat shock protein